MPCWRHEAGLATLSNTWFLCDDCLELERDIAIAVAVDAAEQWTGRTSEGAIAESPTKAGSERPGSVHTSQSPPPGARPERDPVQDYAPAELRRWEWTGEAPPIPGIYLSNVDPGDEA